MEWIPSACTLPSAQRPLRVAEFDVLFATALPRVDRPAPNRLRLTLAGARRAVVEDLIARETACCSFFTFTLEGHDELVVGVEVPAAQIAVLDALAARAAR